MKYRGKIEFNVPPAAVWSVVLDVDQFAACMPGVQNLVRIDDRTFTGEMSAKVGPVSGDFSFRARIVEAEAPVRLRAEVEGTDSLTKSTMTSEIAMDLAALGEDATQLDYDAEVRIKGRLGIVGDMVLRATGAQVVEVFFERLRERVEASPA